MEQDKTSCILANTVVENALYGNDEDIAELFDEHMQCTMWTRAHTDTPFLFSEYIKDYEQNHGRTKLLIAMNTPIHNRYDGNFAHMVLVYIFGAYYMDSDDIPHPIAKVLPLSRITVHDALRTLYYWIVVQDNALKYAQRDYYNETPHDMLVYLSRLVKDTMYMDYLRSFKVLFKFGPHMVLFQKLPIMVWIERRRLAKRKKAVRVIEMWWLSIILNPYHAVGKRYLHKRGEIWHAYIGG